MAAGEVRNVRELRGRIQADVVVGMSSQGTAVVKVETNSLRVRKALDAVKAVLREEAGELIKAAQDEQERRGRTAVGR